MVSREPPHAHLLVLLLLSPPKAEGSAQQIYIPFTGGYTKKHSKGDCQELQRGYDACVASSMGFTKLPRGKPNTAARRAFCQRKHASFAENCLTSAPSPAPTASPTFTPATAVNCSAGTWSDTGSEPCISCGLDHYCEGGPQPEPVRVECPLGLGTLFPNATSINECVVLPCDPCGEANPDLYITSALSIYKQPAWEEGLDKRAETAELQCELDRTDPALCTTQAEGSCTLNDIAIDNQGNYILLGRRSSSGTGWVIKVKPEDIVPGEPCPYSVLINTLAEPWAGLGAAPESNLFYGIGDGQVFTVQVNETSAGIIGSVSNPAFTGAADVTAGPDGNIYAVVGTKAYEIEVDADYKPTGTTSVVATGGITTGAAAFCTSEQPYGISGTNADVYEFLNTPDGSFDNVGGSGWDSGVNGAAVAPVCGANLR